VVAPGLAQPVFVTSAPGDPRLFVLERTGVVRTIGPDATVTAEPYLDLRDVVGSSSIEQGLLGLAFHPGFEENGRLFVYYTLPSDDSRLVEFAAAPGATTVDASTGRVVLEVEQPAERHNGGMIVFDPEGLLYLSLGDGGSGGEHGQRTDTVLGSILRLDVDRGDPYAIPAGNPFAAGGGAPEIWAYGMRNPWRFTIDPIDRLVYVGDVGQEDREEIDVLSLDGGAGSNLGWRVMEGSRCFAGPCDPAGFVLPVVEYGHDEGCSVTGGHVYRGAAIPELDGHYFYADWCRGWVRSFRYAGGAAVDQTDWSADLEGIGQVNGWGIGPDGELYAATWGGTVVRLVAVR
jgi:glucose/arabinose dehydrogenase